MSKCSEKEFEIRFACSALDRMVGLLQKKRCGNGEVLIIAPCSSVHSFGMKEPIDVAFVDSGGRVLKSVANLQPARLSSCWGAACVLERRSPRGEQLGAWFQEGDTINLLAIGVDRDESL